MESPEHGIRVFNRDTLKYAAAITMAAGHFTGNFPFILHFIPDPALRRHLTVIIISLAVFAPPVFFCFIAEGSLHTRSRAKYALRLFVLALASQVAFCLMKHMALFTPAFFKGWNIAATLFLGLICLYIWDSRMKLWLKIPLILLIDAFTVVIKSEWTVFGIPMILGFRIFREKPRARFIWYFSLVLIQQGIFVSLSGIASLISKGYLVQTAALLLGYFAATSFYSGKKGKHPVFSKWFFYIFYPAHMFVIFLFKRMLYT